MRLCVPDRGATNENICLTNEKQWRPRMTAQPPDSTPFPRLAVELRLQILGKACCVERIVRLLLGQGHLVPITHHTLAVLPVLPVLHACSESRGAALKSYDLAFHPHNCDHGP